MIENCYFRFISIHTVEIRSLLFGSYAESEHAHGENSDRRIYSSARSWERTIIYRSADVSNDTQFTGRKVHDASVRRRIFVWGFQGRIQKRNQRNYGGAALSPLRSKLLSSAERSRRDVQDLIQSYGTTRRGTIVGQRLELNGTRRLIYGRVDSCIRTGVS